MDNCLLEFFGLEDKVERHDCANCPFKNHKNCYEKYLEVYDISRNRFHDYLYSMNRKNRRKLTSKDKDKKWSEILEETISEVIKEAKQ